MTLNAKMTMPDLQRYPWKLCLIKYELDINVFVSLNCLFLCKSDLRIACLYEAMEKLTEMITLRVRKTTVFSRCLIKLRFQGYRWKSDIAIFAWRVPEITLTIPLLKKRFVIFLPGSFSIAYVRESSYGETAMKTHQFSEDRSLKSIVENR